MSLDNIQLPPIVISNFYRYQLIEINNDKKKIKIIKSEALFLDGNEKDVFLLINDIEVPFLTDSQSDFLSGILSACRLNLRDAAIISLKKLTEKETFQSFKASKIIAFGIHSSAIGLPFNVPEFQVQLYNNQTYLFIPELDNIQKQTDLKRKLWVALKEIFSIKN